jgi:hypothetical protein
MTTETPSIAQVEAIYSFDDEMLGTDMESGQAHRHVRRVAHFTVPVVDGELSEAVVLLALLEQLSARERQHLVKVSLCFAFEAAGNTLAPWLTHPDSPLCGGKLWLKQHICHEVY